LAKWRLNCYFMLKSFKYYGNNCGNRTHVETKDLANYNNWLLKNYRGEVIFPINSGHWSLMGLSFILYINNAWVSFHHTHITLVKLNGPYHCWKFHAIITKNVHVKSYLLEFLIRKHKNFKMSSMLVCFLHNSFDSFWVAQNGKKLHNTKLVQEKDSKWCTKA